MIIISVNPSKSLKIPNKQVSSEYKKMIPAVYFISLRFYIGASMRCVDYILTSKHPISIVLLLFNNSHSTQDELIAKFASNSPMATII